jgi:hypothetical protein
VLDVSYSRAFRWFILLLLPLTLGWKLAVQLGNPGELKDEIAYRKVAEFLVRQHFTVTKLETVAPGAPLGVPGAPVIRATGGLCRILVAISGYTGSDRDSIRSNATAADTVFVVFGGRIYVEQPTWLTTLDSLWAKFQNELGLKAQATPVFVIIASQSCDAERLPWNQLG